MGRCGCKASRRQVIGLGGPAPVAAASLRALEADRRGVQNRCRNVTFGSRSGLLLHKSNSCGSFPGRSPRCGEKWAGERTRARVAKPGNKVTVSTGNRAFRCENKHLRITRRCYRETGNRVRVT